MELRGNHLSNATCDSSTMLIILTVLVRLTAILIVMIILVINMTMLIVINSIVYFRGSHLYSTTCLMHDLFNGGEQSFTVSFHNFKS